MSKSYVTDPKRVFQIRTFLLSEFHNYYVGFHIRALEKILNQQSTEVAASNYY